MRRALICFCLAAGCGLPDLDTPATRADVAGPYPDLLPRSEIRARVERDTATAAVADLPTRGAGVAARGAAARAQGAVAIDQAAIPERADGLRSRAQGIRDLATPADATAAADLRQRAAAIRAGQGFPAATIAPAEPDQGDAEAAERLRRLRLLRDGTAEDPL